MSQRIIPFTKPIVGHEGEIHEVVVREPRFEEYRRHGDPFILAQSADGSPYIVEKSEVLQEYEDILVVRPEPQLLRQSDFRLARDIRQTILGFFLQGAEVDEASMTSPTTSSSSGTSGLSTSTA